MLAFSCDLCAMQFCREYVFYNGPQLMTKRKIEESLKEYSFLFLCGSYSLCIYMYFGMKFISILS